mmetsp:Transcript_4484/g.6703  ORF Transcript_4484/g.6703 Transcript_4484/m.6703 type:complete len:171 (-) Transcript_4484:27-539(-)
MSDVADLEVLSNLHRFREVTLFGDLDKASADLKKAGKSGYQILMRETSDLMQNLAQAYGERHCLDYCISQLQTLKSSVNKKVLSKIFTLFAVENIRRDLAFYLLHGAVSNAAAKNLDLQRVQLVKEVAEQSLDILDSLNIPKHALYTPITGDYVTYNSVENFGEVVVGKM